MLSRFPGMHAFFVESLYKAPQCRILKYCSYVGVKCFTELLCDFGIKL